MKPILIAFAILVAAPANAQNVARWRPYIAEASIRFGVPTSWIERVIRAESAGWTMIDGRPIRSRAGAMGLMQLMPTTWTEMRSRLRLGADPDDPRDNILAGTLYLRLLYDRFGYPALFAAYNAGPARYADYLTSGRSLPRETTNYLQTATGSPLRSPSSPATRSPPTLFAVRREVTEAVREGSAGGPVPPAMFAIRHGGQ